MRSSETRSRNGLADAGRRTSKTLKLRLAKQVPHLSCTPAEAAQPQAAPSLLYSKQLWAASGHLQQQLRCDREIYFSGLVVMGPLVKQVPADSSAEAQQGKRAKLAGGQYRRSFRDAPCDSTPPGTPLKPGRQQEQYEPQQQYEQQQQQQQYEHLRPSVTLEERPICQAPASTSSSSSFELRHMHRLSTCGAAARSEDHCSSVAWPVVVVGKQKRSSRRRRSLWQQWPPVLQDCGAEGNVPAASAAGSAAGQHQQQVLLPCALQQLVTPMQLDEHQPFHAGVVQPAPAALHCVQQCAVREIAAAFPSKASKGLTADLKAGTAAAGGDVSPGHETSQSSETTMCRDSPRAVAGAALSSWPSSSTESDCQVHMHELDGVHKAAAAAVAAAAGNTAVNTAVAGAKRPQAVTPSANWARNGVC